MKFTEQEIKKIETTLNQAVVVKCPICGAGSSQLNLTDMEVQLVSFNREEHNLTPSDLKYSRNIAVVCKHCGHTMLFNADVLLAK